jgi:hypothetical protein
VENFSKHYAMMPSREDCCDLDLKICRFIPVIDKDFRREFIKIPMNGMIKMGFLLCFCTVVHFEDAKLLCMNFN